MHSQQLLHEIDILSPELQKQVSDFVVFLLRQPSRVRTAHLFQSPAFVKVRAAHPIRLYISHVKRYYLPMPIKSFKCAETESLFKRHRIKRFAHIESVARRKLEQLDWASVLDDLRVPPAIDWKH